MLLLPTITVEPFFGMYLKDVFEKEGLNIKLNPISFNEYFLQENLDKLINADQILVWVNIDCFYPNLINDLSCGKVSTDEIEQDIQNKFIELNIFLKHKTRASVLWMGAEDYCYYPYTYFLGCSLPNKGLIDHINIILNERIEENDTYVDLKTIIAKLGIERVFDNKSKYRWNIPYSRDLLRAVASEVHKKHLICSGITKKCVVLDCDNVLWGGILSEDGIEGIKIGGSGLGRSFQDFQRYLLDLYYHGVILTVCSKNDEADVMRVFNEHTGMLLKEEHIACFKCNWNNKSDNIRYISEILNIGIDSIVFVDDSIFEIESVKSMLPDVTTVLYHRDTVYDELSCFNLKQSTDLKTINERTSTYKTNLQREELRNNSSTHDEYVSSLDMVIDIHETQIQELARISELTQRTNKFTNGVRYTLDELKANFDDEKYNLYTVCLSDKFSNLGVVGAIGLVGETIDLFSLSCRALGRGIEDHMISFVHKCGLKKFIFFTTGRNDIINMKLSAVFKNRMD